jgi:hypothetical protein
MHWGIDTSPAPLRSFDSQRSAVKLNLEAPSISRHGWRRYSYWAFGIASGRGLGLWDCARCRVSLRTWHGIGCLPSQASRTNNFKVFTTWVLKRYNNELQTSEMFSTAGRTVKSGLVASAVVSSWTWAATLLQSSSVAFRYGMREDYRTAGYRY